MLDSAAMLVAKRALVPMLAELDAVVGGVRARSRASTAAR